MPIRIPRPTSFRSPFALSVNIKHLFCLPQRFFFIFITGHHENKLRFPELMPEMDRTKKISQSCWLTFG
jgi:hypothetical protein